MSDTEERRLDLKRTIAASKLKMLQARVEPKADFMAKVRDTHPKWLSWSGIEDFFAKQLYIVDMQQQLIPFRLKPDQRLILAKEIKARRAGLRPWFIVLKDRKRGVTTLEQAIAYWTTWGFPHQRCITIAHEEEALRAIFKQVGNYYDHQPEWSRHEKSKANIDRLEFVNGWDSYFIAHIAGGGGVGRGETFSRLHLSEAAFYKDLNKIHTSVANSVGPHTAYIIESTPNGREGDGGKYYEFWQQAKKGYSHFIPIFLPWHTDKKHRIRLRAPDELGQLSAEEQDLMKKHNLSLEQINWWRDKRKALIAGGSMSDMIHQEHPSDDDTAFLYGAAGYFDRNLLTVAEAMCVDPIRVEMDGHLRIYEEPQNVPYSIGCDIAEGVGRDDSTAVGINTVTGRQAFAFQHNRYPPDEFGRTVLAQRDGNTGLAWMYRNTGNGEPAFLTIERNNHGHATLSALLNQAGFPREKLYHYTEPTKDSLDSKPDKRPGWPHTGVTHIMLQTAVGRMLREGYPMMLDKETVRSIRRVGIGPSGADFQGRDLAVAIGLAMIGLPDAKEAGSSLIFVGGEIKEI